MRTRGGCAATALRALAGATILAVALAACADDAGDPITKVVGPRVLAITTEPSALQLDRSIRVAAVTVDPLGPRVGIAASPSPGARPVDAVRIRACVPWKFIADPSRDCVGPDALILTPDAAGVASVSAAELAAAFPAPPGVATPPDPWRAAIAAGVNLRVPIVVEVDVDGETLIARRDLWVVETDVDHRNPVIDALEFDGVATQTLRAGQRYELTVTVASSSLDDRPGDDASASQLEQVTGYFYSSGGELLERDASLVDPDAATPQTAARGFIAGDTGLTWLFVVATDQTGGTASASVPITIE